jgi:DNA-binding NtrC family response regulator
MEHADEIELVLTDITMPMMSGPEMVDRILKERPAVKVLFMTGLGGSEVLPAHYRKRFPVLAKPFTPAVLHGAVRDCLRA